MKTIIFLTSLSITSNFFGQAAGSGMTDIDGNLYNSVIIGTQEWVKENLNVYDNYDWEALVGDRIVYLAVSEIEHFNEP